MPKKQKQHSPNWGGAGRGQGRKVEVLRFRKLDGTPFTAAEQKRIEDAMNKFGLKREQAK